MDLMTKYKWLWVIVAMIFVSVVISLIFLLINKCISGRGKHKISRLPKDFSVQSNKYQETNSYQKGTFKADVPALPPRTQFLTGEAQSYENLAEAPDHQQTTPKFEQDSGEYEEATPEYEEATPDYVQATPDYEQADGDYEQADGDYEQATPDYEQDMPDYVTVDEEEKVLPLHPPHNDPDPAEDNVSTEDYDDIGGEDETQGEEDYDDVG